MSLRDQLEAILPSLLPSREEEAIKGTELISRVRAVLGEAYSDHSLRSQFSFLTLDPDSCLARVPNGQGYYLKQLGTSPSLHSMFDSETEASREGNAPSRKSLALAVRLCDTEGLSAFVYPTEEESWTHPDLVAVQWPAGQTDETGAYVFLPEEEGEEKALLPSFRAICVGYADSPDAGRRALFRALSCGLWAQEAELLLLLSGEECLPDDTEQLCRLATRFGVGLRLLDISEEELEKLPRADILFRASTEEARELVAQLPLRTLIHPRRRTGILPSSNVPPDIAVVLDWAQRCLARGRVEACEQRVAIG